MCVFEIFVYIFIVFIKHYQTKAVIFVEVIKQKIKQ